MPAALGLLEHVGRGVVPSIAAITSALAPLVTMFFDLGELVSECRPSAYCRSVP